MLSACAPAWRIAAKRNAPDVSNCPTVTMVLTDFALSLVAFRTMVRAYRAHDDDKAAVSALAGLGLVLGANLAEITCQK